MFLALTTSAQTPALLLRFPFDDAYTGTSYTTADAVSSVTLQMVNGAGNPFDCHGQPNSGVATLGRALDFSSNTQQPNNGYTGPLANDINDAALGYGTISNFVATIWFKQDTLINSSALSPRLFILGPNGTTSDGQANSISMKLNTASQMQYLLNNGTATTTASANFGGALPTNTWFFFAVVYDSANVMIYEGTEANPVTLISTTPAANLTFNIGSAGSLFVGNNNTRNRSLDGFIDDFRFYTGYGDLNFIEGIRREAAPTPIIGNFYPNGLLEPTNAFTFTANSQNGINTNTGVQVILYGSDGSSNFTNNVTAQLSFSGPQTNVTVRYVGLVSNTTYTAVITVADTFGIAATTTANFDTYAPLFVWEAENWDFNNGQYIDNPIVSTNSLNSYYGQVGVSGVDETVVNYNNPAGQPYVWRPGDRQSTAVSGDFTRQQFITAGIPDSQVGFFAAGNWLNYTKTFPSGTYYIYGRLAEGAGGTGTASLSVVTNGWGTSTQGTMQLGNFSFTGSGWSSFVYVPLTDNNGNPIAVTLNGTNTLRVTSTTAAGVNLNFFMFMPAKTNLPSITQVYPDGKTFFQNTNKLVFKASGPYAINTGNIQLTLNGVDVSSNLVFTGSSLSWNGSYTGLQPNLPYSAVIKVTDVNGGSFSYIANFDTFASTNFTWEAEDFDFNNGQFIDNPIVSANPQANCYFQIGFVFGTPAVVGVDLTTTDTAGAELFDYRIAESCGTATNQDIVRSQFSAAGTQDYYVGWWTAPQWINYTRTFPANSYYIYARMAAASGTTFNLTNDLVTGGWGTSNQTSQVLGIFKGTGKGFQGWQWVQLSNTNGQPVKVSLSGTNTLKMTAGASINANFYMLVPAPTVANSVTITATRNGSNINLSFPTQMGFTYTVYYKNSLSDSTWSTLTSVSGDGTVKTVNDGLTGTARFYRVGIQ